MKIIFLRDRALASAALAMISSSSGNDTVLHDNFTPADDGIHGGAVRCVYHIGIELEIGDELRPIQVNKDNIRAQAFFDGPFTQPEDIGGRLCGHFESLPGGQHRRVGRAEFGEQ